MENVDDERKLKEFTETKAMQRFDAGILFGELTVYLAVFWGTAKRILQNSTLVAN